MKKTILSLISLLIWLMSSNIFACTVFMGSKNGVTLVGSNEDYKKSNSQVFFVPRNGEKYGYALFGYNGSIQSGVNEKGLFWDGLRAYPYSKSENIQNKYNIGGNVLHKILEECSTVMDVILLFEKYYWEGFRLSQLMIVDRNGESAIITNGENGLAITKKEGCYQVCSNFRISSNESTLKPYWFKVGGGRFNKTEKKLQKLEINETEFISILKSNRQKNIFSKTIYSTLINLNSCEILLTIDGDFSRMLRINLNEELNKGRHSYFLAELVNTTNENRTKVAKYDADFLTLNLDTIHFDKDWAQVKKISKAAYYRIIERDSILKNFIGRDYFLNNILQGEVYYSSINPEIADGKYSEFYDNGKKKVSGQFKYRLKHGEWKYWSKEGELERVIEYTNGIKNDRLTNCKSNAG